MPTLVEVWAPTCSACRAMEADIRHVAAEFADRVRFEQVDASTEAGLAQGLGVLGTPTLIGYVGGAEVYRATGRRTRPELEAVFDGLAEGSTPRSGPTRSDLVLRLGTGGALVLAGVLIGGAWPLALVGGTVIVATLIPILRRRRADRS